MSLTEVRGQTIMVVRRAKVAKLCNANVGWDECGRLIPPGQDYADSIAPPWHEFNPNPGHWTHHAICDLHPVWWPKAVPA